MRVGREFVTGLPMPTPSQHYTEQQLSNVAGGLKGRLFVSEDEYEFISFFDAPPYLDGRVVMAARGIFVPVGEEKRALTDMTTEHGKPSFGGENAPRIYWGDVASAADCAGVARRFDGNVWVADGHRMDIRSPDLFMPWWFDTRARGNLFKCGPVLTLSTAGNPSGTGRPMQVVVRLFDVALLSWYEEQKHR